MYKSREWLKDQTLAAVSSFNGSFTLRIASAPGFPLTLPATIMPAVPPKERTKSWEFRNPAGQFRQGKVAGILPALQTLVVEH